MTEHVRVQTSQTERPSGRSFLLDLLKAVGCILIVLHHLAFYGPMSDVVARAWPDLIDWLTQHARLAVQMFLVCSGFLTAQAMRSMPALSLRTLARASARRYLRLALPLLAALGFTVLLSEIIRPSFPHDSLSAVPGWWQALAHVLFLQHLLGMEALSAGVWYVAVDFQLYLSALLVAWIAQWLQLQGRGGALRWQALFIVLLMLSSITHWTHRDVLEDTALFFWAAYGMGWLAWHSRIHLCLQRRWLMWLALGFLCWLFDTRGRALTAWAVASLLACAPVAWLSVQAPNRPWQLVVQWLSRISYSVFVVHFGVSLLVNYTIGRLWPLSLSMNALGMALALSLSLLAGDVLYRLIESRPATWRRWMVWSAAFMASTGLAMWLAT